MHTLTSACARSAFSGSAPCDQTVAPTWSMSSFVFDGKHILIFSQPTSQKIRNVQHNPHVTIGLDETKGGEDMVILEGKAELLHDPAVNPTLPAYAAKYDSELQRVGLTAEAMAAVYSQALLITPTRFFHRQGTRGQRVEVIT